MSMKGMQLNYNVEALWLTMNLIVNVRALYVIEVLKN